MQTESEIHRRLGHKIMPQSDNEEWDARVDVFVVGVMFLEMVAGVHPFIGNAQTEQDVIDNIKGMKLHIPRMFHPAAVSFQRSTVCYQYLRMDSQQCLKHQFIKQYVGQAIAYYQFAEKSMMTETSSKKETYFDKVSFFKEISGIDFVGNGWGDEIVDPKPPVINPEPPVINLEPPVINPERLVINREPPVINSEPPVINFEMLGQPVVEMLDQPVIASAVGLQLVHLRK